MKLLFIARTYPPAVGGMQTFASEFYKYYKELGAIDLLANSGGNRTLISFLFRTLIDIALNSRNYDVIHLSDAVLSPLIPLIKLFSSAKVSLTAHGLDIIYTRFGYQLFIPFFLKKADRVIANSTYTMKQCEARGVSGERLRVFPMGIASTKSALCSPADMSKVITKFHIDIKRTKILLTVGRLVKRKGHAWLVSEVLTRLPENYIYLIAGSGPEFELIKNLSVELGLTDRVYLLGNVSEQEKTCLYQIADLFVMPNVRVKGDQEGFGIAILEAGQQGLPVIASKIEGIVDAILDGKTGRLIEEGDAQGFVDRIMHPQLDATSIAAIVSRNYNWKEIVVRYKGEFDKMMSG